MINHVWLRVREKQSKTVPCQKWGLRYTSTVKNAIGLALLVQPDIACHQNSKTSTRATIPCTCNQMSSINSELVGKISCHCCCCIRADSVEPNFSCNNFYVFCSVLNRYESVPALCSPCFSHVSSCVCWFHHNDHLFYFENVHRCSVYSLGSNYSI